MKDGWFIASDLRHGQVNVNAKNIRRELRFHASLNSLGACSLMNAQVRFEKFAATPLRQSMKVRRDYRVRVKQLLDRIAGAIGASWL